MSNIAGKAYAMNLMTPFKKSNVWMNHVLFWIARIPMVQKNAFKGLLTLSIIHYARWVIVGSKQLPWLGDEQPKEKLNYAYMFFFSNFNGSWNQYIDSFSIALHFRLNLMWYKSVGKPGTIPETPFNQYVLKNQIWTEHYYTAYPMATSNDVKSAKRVKEQLLNLCENLETVTEDEFMKKYNRALFDLQADLSQMEPTPVVSLANEAIEKIARLKNHIN
jgi:hypothetical protein